MNDPKSINNERKEGIWVYTTVTGGMRYWYCSVCESAYHRKDPHDRRYCYFCGARMKKEGQLHG